MFGVVIKEYGDETKLVFEENLIIPQPKANQVLIEVFASSVNPIDLMKREGYGNVIFEKQRQKKFPWILGSDFSGKVKALGSNVTKLEIGDEVWGCTSHANAGTHAEFVCIDIDEVTKKPLNLSHIEAASLPYVALTTWSALVRWAGVRPGDLENKKVFIQGGAGGVGCFAIQLFKDLGCEVATTCSEKNMELVRSLGVDHVIDYNRDSFENKLEDYDIVYDLLGNHVTEDSVGKCCKILKKDKNSHYITLTHDFVNTLDGKGLLMGLPHAFYLRQKQRNQYRPINIHWSLYRPSLSGLEYLTDLVEKKIIKPVIDSSFSLYELSKAHVKLGTGHVSGKITIDHKND